MAPKDIIGLIIIGTISLALLIMSVILMRGKGSWLIAGYNTANAKDKEKYDSVALCKFVGKILFPIALFSPSIAIAGIFKIKWISIAFPVLVLGLIVFAVIYANTKNRFQK